MRSVSADPLFRLELTKYLAPIVSAQPQHTLLRAHLILLSGDVVPTPFLNYPPDHAKMKAILPPALSVKASAGAGSPLGTSVPSADFVLHIS